MKQVEKKINEEGKEEGHAYEIHTYIHTYIHNVVILCFLGLKTQVEEEKNVMTTYKRPITHFPMQTIEIIMSSLEMFVMCLIQVFIVKVMQAIHELLPINTYVEGDQAPY